MRWARATMFIAVAPLMQCGETQFGAGSGDGGGVAPSPEASVHETGAHEAAAHDASTDAADASVRFAMPTVVARGQPQPKGIAVDTNYLYWVDAESASGGAGSVQAMKKGTTTPAQIASGQVAPLDLVLDDTTLFWSVNTGGTAPAGAQCLAMRLNKLLIDGTQCVTGGPLSTTRLTITTDALVLIGQPGGGANVNPILVVTAKAAASTNKNSPLQGPSVAVGASSSSAFVGNSHGPHIDTYPLAPPFTPADPGLCGAQDCAGTGATAGASIIQDIAVASDSKVFWVVSNGAVLALSAAAAGEMPTTLGMVPGAPQRIALDGSYVYVTSATGSATGAISAVPIAGGEVQTLANPDCAPFGIAVDTLNVYWTCSDGTVRAVGIP